MNLAVAEGAGLILRRLVVYRPAGANRREGVALQAEHVHDADFQQPGIGGTVGGVATGAALGLHRHVLVDERSLLVDVALVTNGIPARQTPHLFYSCRAVRVMAVGALHQAFIHPVMKGFGKVRLGGSMAAVAQLGLLLNQQILLALGVVRRVTVKTSNCAAGVGGLGKVRLFVTFAVAGQTAGAGFLPGLALEDVYFAFVAASGDVLRARPVATLATLLGWTARFVQRGFPVRRLFPGVVNLFVTGFAGFRSHILGGFGGRGTDCLGTGGLSALPLRLRLSRSEAEGGEEYGGAQKNS